MKGNIRKKIISTSFFFFTYICYRDKIILDGDYVNRQEDLTNVFDKRWKANHNDDVKKARNKEKNFMNKMFNTNINTISNNSVITPDEMARNLHNNMNSANRGINQSKINRIVGKFK